MLELAGGLMLAVIGLIALAMLIGFVRLGWGQWRCLIFGHRWKRPVEDGSANRARRTTGVLSWMARSHCSRCDHFALLLPKDLASRWFAPRTWEQS